MGVGGATWETAGTLEMGVNTFDQADASGAGTHYPYFGGWFTWTPASTGRLTLNADGFDSFDPIVAVAIWDLSDPPNDPDDETDYSYFATEPMTEEFFAGVTYLIKIGSVAADGGGVETYTLTTSFQEPTYTPWNSSLRDDPENYVIISQDGYSLQDPLHGQPWEDWMALVIRRFGHSVRFGTYGVIEVLGGDDPNDANGCIWDHALNGDLGTQTWNGPGDGPTTPTPAVCAMLGTDANDEQLSNNTVGYEFEPAGPPPGLGIARTAHAEITLDARALYFKPIRDNLPPRGRLNFPNQGDSGAPDTAFIEWESERPDLVEAYYTVDAEEWPSANSLNPLVDPKVSIAMRDVVKSTYTAVGDEGDGDYSFWPVGIPGEWDLTRDGYLYGQWLDGDRDWVEITGLFTGDDGTDSLSDPGGAPDENATIGTAQAWLLDERVEGTHYRNADIALKVYVRSPRFRWRYYTEAGAIPPRRILGRPDGATSGAGRVLGGGHTRQTGSRTVGAIL